MALTNEQYDALMREYNHKQSRNNQIVSFRTKELYSAVPSLSSIDEEVSLSSLFFNFYFLAVVHSFTKYTMLIYGMPVLVSRPISQVRLFE